MLITGSPTRVGVVVGRGVLERGHGRAEGGRARPGRRRRRRALPRRAGAAQDLTRRVSMTVMLIAGGPARVSVVFSGVLDRHFLWTLRGDGNGS